MFGQKEEIKLYMCPSCGKKHKWKTTGEYCDMTCFYKLNGA